MSDQYSDDLRYYRMRHYCGKSCINELDQQANIGFKMLINDLEKQRGGCLFSTDPPLEYTIIVLWTFVFSYISSKKGDDFLISVDEIHNLIEDNFMNWGGKKKLLRRSWIVNALNKMVEFNLISKGEQTDTFKVKFERKGSKDILRKIEIKIVKKLQKKQKPKIKIKSIKQTRQTDLLKYKKESKNAK